MPIVKLFDKIVRILDRDAKDACQNPDNKVLVFTVEKGLVEVRSIYWYNGDLVLHI